MCMNTGILVARSFVDGGVGGYHSVSSTGAYWQVDLGASYDISRIVYYNRADGGFNSRAIGNTIKGLDASLNVHCEAIITTADLIQTFTTSTTMFLKYVPGMYLV